MQHRHLNHQRLTLAAIDSVISRGQQQDWADLHQAVLADSALLDKIERLCRANINNPYDPDSYAVWMRFVQACRATDSIEDIPMPDIPVNEPNNDSALNL